MNKENWITSDEILGKDVLTKEGEILGVVQQLHIDKINKYIIGITVDEGFMKPDLFIGIENVKLFGVDSIFLKSNPKLSFKGLQVFDNVGKKIGVVDKVIITPRSGKIKELKVKTNNNKIKDISAKEIKSIGVNVILK